MKELPTPKTTRPSKNVCAWQLLLWCELCYCTAPTIPIFTLRTIYLLYGRTQSVFRMVDFPSQLRMGLFNSPAWYRRSLLRSFYALVLSVTPSTRPRLTSQSRRRIIPYKLRIRYHTPLRCDSARFLIVDGRLSFCCLSSTQKHCLGRGRIVNNIVNNTIRRTPYNLEPRLFAVVVFYCLPRKALPSYPHHMCLISQTSVDIIHKHMIPGIQIKLVLNTRSSQGGHCRAF